MAFSLETSNVNSNSLWTYTAGGSYTIGSTSSTFLTNGSSILLTPSFISHEEQKICPECFGLLDLVSRTELIIVPELCDCHPLANVHFIEQCWHRVCYDERGRNLELEVQAAMKELADMRDRTL